MLFNSPIFLFAYLPLVILIYFAVPEKFKNTHLLISSIVFYFWGEPIFIKNLLLMILVNFITALLISNFQKTRPLSLSFLTIGIIANLFFLFYFKYFNFFLYNLTRIFSNSPQKAMPIILPLAISFFTFHAISYIIDVYKKRVAAQRNPAKLSLYFLLFPHLLAGPIVRLTDLGDQLNKRVTTLDSLAFGASRFITGLAKKVLIADTLAFAIDEVFSTPPSHLMPTSALFGMVAYTLQIYFDFSGYSDMAIGLAAIFGFKFPENFNYPYSASSVTEFWRRWHMTLSNWFRDYLYIPLGGNRVSPVRNYLNLIAVFLLVGLWHGAGWNFIFWGLYQGIFLVLERINLLRKVVVRLPLLHLFKHLYLIVIVMFSWVIFRSPNLSYALSFMHQMAKLFDQSAYQNVYHPLEYFLRGDVVLALIMGSILSFPIIKLMPERFTALAINNALTLILLSILFLLSITQTAVQTYNPFIYFRF